MTERNELSVGSSVAATATFDSLMLQGIEAHAAGQHREALGFRTYAYYAATDEVEQARALRDGAASHTYLEEYDEALEAATLSVNLLAEDEHQRERAASRDRLGRVTARIAINAELNGQTPMHNTKGWEFARAWGELRELEKESSKQPFSDPWPATIDQYRITMAPRHAANEALFTGDKEKALWIAARGLGLALLSENPILQHSRGDKIGFRRRAGIAAKDVATAGVALAIAVITPTKTPVQKSRRRTLALRLADKIF